MSAEGVVKALLSPITKVIDVVAKGCGKLYEPKQLEKMYKTRAKGIKLLSETIKAETSEIVYDDGITKIDNVDIVSRAKSRLEYQELVKQKNIEDVIGLTYNEIKNIKSVDAKPLEENWIIRFFNTVQDISNEDLQKIWAKLLAGEIKTPGLVSLRTMEHLKNLTSEEANIFNKVAQYALFSTDGEAFLLRDLTNKDITLFEKILRLDDCGLIKSQSTSLIFAYDDTNTKECIYDSNVKINLLIKKNQALHLEIYKFTSSGTELIKLLDIESNNIAYQHVKRDIYLAGISTEEELMVK